MREPLTDSFEEWWDKLNNAMEKDSMAAWMIYADLPKGIARQLWHDSLKHHKKEIKDAEKETEILTKALKFYANDINWFKKWGHKDNWAIKGSGNTAVKALTEIKELK